MAFEDEATSEERSHATAVLDVEGMKIIPAQARHGAEIDALEARSFSIRRDLLSTVGHMRKREAGHVFVACDAEEHVHRYVSSVPFQNGASRNLWVIALAVDAARRRRGVARGLLEELLRRARSDVVTRIRLQVQVENLAAIALYEQCGFRALRRLENAYGAGLDSFLMVRAVEP